ncbi:zinc finger protein 346 isoform X1 [Salmo salar]|uniref:Zinc finger protein 346 n=2 Tax=Salmo salar TaxID=8030 RepID=A0A1S3RK96_SALSA|nr:zinc finger protein 346-like isoform X1 [Salmo salar]|eukprot:XP_014052706.1 PREDICTED: zinc finger protein 346-like isoform X1 [Salmo salar]
MALEEPNGDFPYLPSGAAEVNKMIQENGDLFSDALCKVCSAVLNSDSQKLAHYQSKKHANKVRRYMSIHKEEEPTIKRFKSPSGDSASSNGETDRSKACHICNMTFSSPVVAESHYQGKVHTKNLRLKTFGNQPAVALPQAVAPVVKKKKKKKEAQSEEASNVASSGPAEDDQGNFCSICHASFNNPLMAKQHYEGKKHKKQLTQQKLMETYGPSTAPASTVKGYPCTVCNIELNSVEQYQAHISGSKHKNHVRGKKVSSPMFISPSENKYTAENQQSEYQYTPEAEPVQEDWGAFSQDYE